MTRTDATLELQPAECVFAYHVRTKHRRERYAAGPETIDWTAPPNPFREFSGCERTLLPLNAVSLSATYGDVFSAGAVAPRELSLQSLGMLLELSMAISAWKEYGTDRWAVRCNPSSGNLHPTETYVLARGIRGLGDGLHHYVVRDHALEQRFKADGEETRTSELWIGLSSVHWREAWKYGERAFRYCQIDTGHALGALRIAAGVLGWTLRLVDDCRGSALARLLGHDRHADFSGVEYEEADLLLKVAPFEAADAPVRMPDLGSGAWTGRANMLDPHPMYHWPVIDAVAAATRDGPVHNENPKLFPPRSSSGVSAEATQLILGRRSAQHFDPQFVMPASDFYRMLDRLLPRDCAPWDVWAFTPRLHPLIFVHRIDGLDPGVYMLVRRSGMETDLKSAFDPEFLWHGISDAPAHLPLFRLASRNCRKIAKMLSCLQAIAGDSCFSMGLIAEFSSVIGTNPWRYRQLHWEAGLIGHLLYLEAEALDLRGTGIGCFFDDDVHDAVGLTGLEFQSLYHFTVGRALTDDRISTLPPYSDRERHFPQEQQS